MFHSIVNTPTYKYCQQIRTLLHSSPSIYVEQYEPFFLLKLDVSVSCPITMVVPSLEPITIVGFKAFLMATVDIELLFQNLCFLKIC